MLVQAMILHIRHTTQSLAPPHTDPITLPQLLMLTILQNTTLILNRAMTDMPPPQSVKLEASSAMKATHLSELLPTLTKATQATLVLRIPMPTATQHPSLASLNLALANPSVHMVRHPSIQFLSSVISIAANLPFRVPTLTVLTTLPSTAPNQLTNGE